MLEKLLSALLHAKSGALATVLVLGTSGALVAAAVDNGMTTNATKQGETTETATDQSNTTTNPVSEAILALFNRTNAEDDPTSTATGKGCSDEAHERNDAMKDVNDAFKEAHQAVLGLSKGAPKSAETRQLVRDADAELKDIRQDAVKDIHATFDCDPNEDEDPTSTATAATNTTTTTDTLTGGTAEEIADEAIEAMEQVVADLEEALEDLEESDEESVEATTTSTDTKQNGKSENKGNKGGNGKGRGR
jgi:hypothetical protein